MSTAPHARGHILIAGPGRSGTTLLVKLLDALGFDTGVEGLEYSDEARAGLEAELLDPEAPYVVKSPALSWRLRGLLESGRLDPRSVDWLIVPLRSLEEAAASRVKTTVEQRNVHADGGLVGTTWPRKQLQWLAKTTYGLFETAAYFDLPLITLEYPRFALDSDYAFRRLKPLLAGRSAEDFDRAWRSVIDPQLISRGPVEDPPLADLQVASMRVRHLALLKLRSLRRTLLRETR